MLGGFSREVLAVWTALAAQRVAKVYEKAPETLDLLASRRNYRRTSGDVFSDLVQRGVQVFGGRPIQPQCDVAVHAAVAKDAQVGPDASARQRSQISVAYPTVVTGELIDCCLLILRLPHASAVEHQHRPCPTYFRSDRSAARLSHQRDALAVG